MAKVGRGAVDFSNNEEVFGAFANEFDMSYWAFSSLRNKKRLEDYNDVFIWQLKGCNIHCPWCYVDDVSKDGKEGEGSRYFSMGEIINAFEQEREKQSLNIIRPSGGEPTLAIDQWLECLDELDERGLSDEVYVQGDTNLTTGTYIEKLEQQGVVRDGILEAVGEYGNFGLLCSFKGTDTESFLRATGFVRRDGSVNKKFAFLEKERWDSFEKYGKANIDVHSFIYDPNPNTLESFMEKGAKKHGDGFYFRTWILPLKLYGPEKERLLRIGQNPEEYQITLDENALRSQEVMQNLLQKKFGVNYQAIPRTALKLSF